MSSTAIDATGSTLEIDTMTAGTPDTRIENLLSFSGLDGEASEIETTNMDSTAKEFKLGLKDNGSFGIEFHVDYDGAGQNELRSAGKADLKTFRLTLPNGKAVNFSGYVKNADSISGAVDQTLNGSASIRITGGVTIA